MTYKITSLLTLLTLLVACGAEQHSEVSQSVSSSVLPATNTANIEHTLVNADGSYPGVPLAKDVITLKVVQSGITSLSDYPTPQEGLEQNLQRMIDLADVACNEGESPDILLYHEFPLTGYFSGSRTEKLEFALTIPGPETDRLGQVARDCSTYIIFGSYAVDPAWPRHILSINTVISPQGEVVKTFWKTRNIKRIYDGREISTTTIEAVRDKYRAMYGIEEEFPVLRTEFGNIAVSTVQLDPFVFAAFAMRGTEIMLRTATLYSEGDVVLMARINDFYSAMSNIALPKGMRYSGGNSIIVAPDGKLLAREPGTDNDSVISAQIPIAEFRAGRKIPQYTVDIVRPVFDQYQQEIPINHLDMPSEELPETDEEMKTLYDRISNWLN